MDVVITEWGLQSYLDLKQLQAFTDAEYWGEIRPDVERLKKGYPNTDPAFQNSNFWGPANLGNGNVVADGFKMKWRNKGPGQVQIRVCIAILGPKAFLCQAYVKKGQFDDYRNAALLQNRIKLIKAGRHTERGTL